MPVFLAFLKIHLLLCTGYLLYRYCLRRLTFFQLNRVFLAGLLLTAAAAPFLSFNLAQPAPAIMQTINIAATAIPTAATPVLQQGDPLWLKVAGWFYAAGAAATAIHFLLRAVSLFTLYRKSRKTVLEGYSIRILKGNNHPFSCFGSIFIDPAQHSKADLLLILQHEQAHIRQKHSIDLLLGILCKISCWCNPAAWALDRSIRTNLEFLADEAVLQTDSGRRQYQYALLHAATGHQAAGFGHSFNATHLKSRIHMMNKPRSSTPQLLRYGVASVTFTALLLTVGLSFGQQKRASKFIVQQKATSKKTTQKQTSSTTVSTKKHLARNSMDQKKVKPSLTERAIAADSTFELNIDLNPGTAAVNLKTLSPTSRPLLVIDGKIDNLTSLQAIPTDRVESITVLKDDAAATAKYGEAAKNGVILVTMKQ